jgi:hypothetical protein
VLAVPEHRIFGPKTTHALALDEPNESPRPAIVRHVEKVASGPADQRPHPLRLDAIVDWVRHLQGQHVPFAIEGRVEEPLLLLESHVDHGTRPTRRPRSRWVRCRRAFRGAEPSALIARRLSGKLTVRIFGLLAAEAEGPIAIGALILIVFLAMTAAIVAKLFAV